MLHKLEQIIKINNKVKILPIIKLLLDNKMIVCYIFINEQKRKNYTSSNFHLLKYYHIHETLDIRIT